jgi:glycosyltransferase involved in cell wall biosynthesis
MNILQVYQVFNPEVASGAAKVAYDIARLLVKKGHKVIFYASDMKDWLTRGVHGDSVVDGVVARRFKTLWPVLSSKFKIYFTPQLGVISGDEIQEFDVIHLHGYISFQSIVISHYARKYGVPYVLQAHGSLPKIGSWRRLKWLYDVLFGCRLLRNASKVIALSRFEAEQYRRMGVPEEKIAIIPNGIDLSEYAVLPPKGAFKRKFGIPEEKKIILYLGRIHKIKGIDFLVKAYSYLINDVGFKDALLVIAGPDDGYLKEVKSLTSAMGISKHVLFTGPLYGQDKLEAYVDSEFCVLPSRYETFPMTVLEAYACGKPVIASEVGGLKDLIINEETGLLFEPGNVKWLTRSIFNLTNGNDVAKEMGLKGKNFVRENFTIEKVVEKLEKVYEVVNCEGILDACCAHNEYV